MHIFGGDNIYMLNYKLCIENRLFNPVIVTGKPYHNKKVTFLFVTFWALLLLQ